MLQQPIFLRWGCYTEIPLPPFKLDILLPQHLFEAKGVLGVGGVCFYLVEEILLSSLSIRPLDVKVGVDLVQGHLEDPGFLLTCGEGHLPSRQLLLLRKKLLLQLFRRR
jgi:hypothetical protein